MNRGIILTDAEAALIFQTICAIPIKPGSLTEEMQAQIHTALTLLGEVKSTAPEEEGQ